jgi:hypothetical protein
MAPPPRSAGLVALLLAGYANVVAQEVLSCSDPPNGGCDPHTACEEIGIPLVGTLVQCSACPRGFYGSGRSGCHALPAPCEAVDCGISLWYYDTHDSWRLPCTGASCDTCYSPYHMGPYHMYEEPGSNASLGLVSDPGNASRCIANQARTRAADCASARFIPLFSHRSELCYRYDPCADSNCPRWVG